jgi:hypothetical protein
MRRVLSVGLKYTGEPIDGTVIDNLGLCRPEVSESRAAFPLYEYDVIVINPESYSHFLFGKPSKFSSSDTELYDLKKSNGKYDLDSAFDFTDRSKELDAAIKKGATVVWCLTSDERTNFFGYRTRHLGYLSERAQEFIKKSDLTVKKGRSFTILDEDNPFNKYITVLSKTGWRECLADPSDGYDSVVDTPESYSLAGRLSLGKRSAWLVTSPRTQDAANQLIRDCLSVSEPGSKRQSYHSIFMSHTFADKTFVRKLRKDLMEHGVGRVWVDEAEIEIGDSLISKIEEGMKETRYIGVILSKAAVGAPWVKKELDVAMTNEIAGGKPIVLPLLYEKCDIPAFLTGKLYADFTTPEKYEESLEKLLRRLRIR